MSLAQDKLIKLKASIKEMGSVAVAFSGGVDSTFLLAVATEVLGENAVAVIGRSPTYPSREMEEALKLAQQLGVTYEIVDMDELNAPGFKMNPPHRCFLCKSTLFECVWKVAKERGIEHALEGSNADDTGDFRPGMEASKKLGVHSPLLDAGLTKDEIRELSKQMDLPTWEKPAFACLSSRIPYGEEINVEKLSRIERAEDALRDMGIGQLRVRDHGDVARLEVPPGKIEELSSNERRAAIASVLKEAGYKYACIDMIGYRTGAMNETLTADQQVKAKTDPI